MRTIAKIVCMAALLGLASAAMAVDTMTQLWKVDENGVALSWYDGGNNTRGMSYDPFRNEILVVDRGALNVVRRINPTTGAEITPNYTGGYDGGTFVCNKVGCTETGVVFVVNLKSNSDVSILNVYRQASPEAALGAVVYTETGNTQRMGDDIDFYSNGNDVKIIISGSGSTVVRILTSTDVGLTFTATTVTPSPALVGIPNVAWDTTTLTEFWVKKSAATTDETTTAVLCDASGVAKLSRAGAPGYGSVDVVNYGAKKLIAIGPSALGGSAGPVPAGPIRAYIYDAADNSLLLQTGAVERSDAVQLNGNGSGDVYIDIPNHRFYVLYTNNALSAWTLPIMEVSDWTLMQ